MVGIYLGSHPFISISEQAKAASTHTLHEIRELGDRERATICGIVTNLREHTVKKSGKKMLYATIEDNEVSLEVTVFNKNYEKCKDFFVLDKPVVLSGSVSMDEVEGSDVSVVKFFVDTACSLDEAPILRRKARAAKRQSRAVLTYQGYIAALEAVKSLLGALEGQETVFLELPDGQVWEVA
jgi:DNA polymerase III alpha subunit